MNRFLWLLVSASSAFASVAMACPPQPNVSQYERQQKWLSDLSESEEVMAKIVGMGADVTISSIRFGSKFNVTLSNGCRLKVERDTKSSPVGTCYDLVPLSIMDERCPSK